MRSPRGTIKAQKDNVERKRVPNGNKTNIATGNMRKQSPKTTREKNTARKIATGKRIKTITDSITMTDRTK